MDDPNSKPVLRLGFYDTFDSAKDFFLKVLSSHFDVYRDDEDPDIVIFGDWNFGNTHKQWDDARWVTKVFYTGENIRRNYHDGFSITFDRVNSPNHFRLPLYVLDMHKEGTLENCAYETKTVPPSRFCTFLVSNGNVPERNQFFRDLCCYKQVSSGGPIFNNIGRLIPKGNIGDKTAFLHDGKFHICFENGSHPGYQTEKLYNALAAGTLPIYWGDPTIGREWNTKAFINCHDYSSFDDVIKIVKFLDSPEGNDEYWKMRGELSRPLIDQKSPQRTIDAFVEWFYENPWKAHIRKLVSHA